MGRVRDFINAALFDVSREEPTQPAAVAGPRLEVGELERQLAELERQLAELDALQEKTQRRSLEYFAVIEKLAKERDEWVTMFMRCSAQHANAQDQMMNAIEVACRRLAGAVAMLNQYREKAGEKAFPLPGVSYKGPTADEYRAAMAAMEAAARPLFDWQIERKRIEDS